MWKFKIEWQMLLISIIRAFEMIWLMIVIMTMRSISILLGVVRLVIFSLRNFTINNWTLSYNRLITQLIIVSWLIASFVNSETIIDIFRSCGTIANGLAIRIIDILISSCRSFIFLNIDWNRLYKRRITAFCNVSFTSINQDIVGTLLFIWFDILFLILRSWVHNQIWIQRS